MKTYIPKKPVGDAAIWTWRRWIWDLLAGGYFPLKGDGNIIVQFQQGVYRISSKTSPANGTSAGGYMGEYDNTKAYSAGQTVRVSVPTTIAGVSVPAGLFGVPPGVSVPANGTGFQIPQFPEPTTFTASPNDKVYWHALVTYCIT